MDIESWDDAGTSMVWWRRSASELVDLIEESEESDNEGQDLDEDRPTTGIDFSYVSSDSDSG